MFALRCTKKLLDRMRVDPESSPAAPTTILGDWYGNLIRVGKQQLILCVSEKTLRRWVARGRIPCVRLGRAIRFDRSDVFRWVSARKES